MFYEWVAFNVMVVLNTPYFFNPAWCLMSSSCLMESRGCYLIPHSCLHSCSSVCLVLWLLLSCHFSATGPCYWLACCFAENSAMFSVGMVPPPRLPSPMAASVLSFFCYWSMFLSCLLFCWKFWDIFGWDGSGPPPPPPPPPPSGLPSPMAASVLSFFCYWSMFLTCLLFCWKFCDVFRWDGLIFFIWRLLTS